MKFGAPGIPWQVTGNHWITLPCIHPADASVHLVSAVHARLRGAIEFAGAAGFLEGDASPLARVIIEMNGERKPLGAEGIAWERELGWIPAFSCRHGQLAVKGTICAPHGRNADLAGAFITLQTENRGDEDAEIVVGLEGSLGSRQLRIRSSREFTDGHSVTAGEGNSILLEGRGADSPLAIAVGGEGEIDSGLMESSSSWWLARRVSLAPGTSCEVSFHIAVGPEGDGAAAVLRVMRRRGASALLASTRQSLREMEPATGNPAADRIVARHVYFAYFGSVARAIDDAHIYVIRSRLPWNGLGLTIRDWEALMWVLPSVLLVDQGLAREVLLRICEMHGYAPGGGVHYLDGSIFEPGFSLEGAASYAIAVDGYIVQSSDEKVVEEPMLADALYGSSEDIELRKHPQLPLYSTEVNPDGEVPAFSYTAHGNAVVALSLDILRHTLDEKTSEKVQDPAAVRAALLRHFSAEGSAGKPVLASASDLSGKSTRDDMPAASMYWLSYFDLVGRDDSLYRRTVKPFETLPAAKLETRCSRLVGPSGEEALSWLRRAPLDNGLAAEIVDADGRCVANGGDAALSGLIAHTVWYAVNVLGLRV